jgi:predicted hotdog family 3-hydroxylacyl-ACP dehydratase
MLTRDDWGALIPHRGAMALLDGVAHWDAQRLLARTGSHRRTDNPLRDGGRLRALHLCEYGAQAMAVHGALTARAAGTAALPGFLVSLRGVRLHVARIDDLAGDLEIEAEKLLDGGASWQYVFRVRHGEQPLAEGRAAVIVGALPGD